MIAGVGVDVVDIDRFQAALTRTPALRARLFTAAENEVSATLLAGRFAAKEALIKALGAPAGLRWHDIEVSSGAGGGPQLMLAGQARSCAEALGVERTHVSISHDATIATAFVVVEC